MFGDTSELQYVVSLIEDYAELASAELSTDEQRNVRGNSPLPLLEKLLRAALVKSGVDAGRLVDSNELMQLKSSAQLLKLDVLQEAYVDALWTVLANPLPSDWTPAVVARFRCELLTVHAIERDRLTGFRDGRGRPRGSEAPTTKYLRKLLSEGGTDGGGYKSIWAAIKRDTRTVKITDDEVYVVGVGQFKFSSLSALLSKARKPSVIKKRTQRKL